jgi:hypothetical protein
MDNESAVLTHDSQKNLRVGRMLNASVALDLTAIVHHPRITNIEGNGAGFESLYLNRPLMNLNSTSDL